MRAFGVIVALSLVATVGRTQEESVTAFVTRLKAQVAGIAIELSWRDAKDTTGVNLVYRHSEQIDRKNLTEAELIARVNFGIEAYVDFPPAKEPFFYAVLVENTAGRIHTVFIAFRNITTAGLTVERVATEDDFAAQVTAIASSVKEDTVVISFEASKVDRDLLVFRDTSPLRKQGDLLNAVSPVVLDGSARQYRDYVVPGVEYYYAVVDAGLYRVGEVKLKMGENTTRDPVVLKPLTEDPGLPAHRAIRPLPLPYLQISSGVEYGSELVSSLPFYLPERRDVSPATSKAIARLIGRMAVAPASGRQVQILEIDQSAPAGGERFSLGAIVQTHLAQREFSEAERLLEEYLDTHRPEDVVARAHFYLAQVYYFLDKYREAFLALLLAREHYLEIEPWLDLCFMQLMRSE